MQRLKDPDAICGFEGKAWGLPTQRKPHAPTSRFDCSLRYGYWVPVDDSASVSREINAAVDARVASDRVIG